MLTTLYAVPMALVYLAVTWYMIGLRRLAKARRVDWPARWYDRCSHGRDHMGQYVPFALFLMLLIEQGQAAAWALHVLGLLLIAGSLLHLWGFARFPGTNSTPQIGMLLISLAYGLACLIGLGQVLGIA